MTAKILLVFGEPDFLLQLKGSIQNALRKSHGTGWIHGRFPVVKQEATIKCEVEESGIEFIPFADGREALNWCQVSSPDMIIADCSILEMNHWQFIGRFREMPHQSNIPVWMVCDIPEPEIRYTALEMGVTDLVCKPVDPVELGLKIRNWLQCGRGKTVIAEPSRTMMTDMNQTLAKVLQQEQEIIFQLSKAVEYREMETGGHITRIAYYAQWIAKTLGLSETEQYLILKTAPLHDVGKVGIPDRILRKTGNLNKEEYEIMKRHTTIGHRILQGSSSYLLQTAAEIALTHHERYNGSGYPQGLHGPEIPLYGRIVALADVFDALTSENGYKKAWEIEDAFEYIQAKSAKHFDPDCVRAFFAGKDQIISIKERYGDAKEIVKG